MSKFIFLLIFAIGFGTAEADAIVKDKNVKESTPKKFVRDGANTSIVIKARLAKAERFIR